MANIVLKQVAKRFGEVSVIEKLDLEILDHEFLVFVGPSGCGKSTVLRMIAGLEEPSEGELYIGGRLVNHVHPKDRDIAMVFQSYALYPHMTVRENIAFGLKIRKTPRAQIDRLVDEAAATLGLKELLDRKPKALSGGQRQRVALGRAIVRKPAVFLFDEPLSNLDAELRVQMRAELAKMQHRLQTTTVYVTHDQVEAMTLGHRIAVLAPMKADRRSNLKQVGSPLELYDRPQNLFVARFIGTPPMNVVGATVTEDGQMLIASGFRSAVPPGYRAALAAYRGKPVLFGMRPEHVGEPGTHDWASRTPLSGVVEIVETVGHEVVIHARCGTDAIVAKLSAHRLPTYGDSLALELNANAVHLFDPDTEQRIAGE